MKGKSGFSFPGHQLVGVLVGLLVLGGALMLLHHELRSYSLHEMASAASAIPWKRIAMALMLTTASYILLTGYDVLALRHVGQKLSYGKTAVTSFTSYVTSHNLGLSGVGGAAVRFRLYTAWGLAAVEIAEIVAFCGLTFWFGFVSLGGVAFVVAPLDFPPGFRGPISTTRPLGMILLLPAALYLVWALLIKKPLCIRSWCFHPPRGRLLLLQLPLAALDWVVAAAVLYVLLPEESGIGYGHVLTAFLAAQAMGMISHVPAGLGVFDTAVLVLLNGDIQAPQMVGALLVYRVVYYLLPLMVGAVLFLGTEATLQRKRLGDITRWIAPAAGSMIPRALAMVAFIAGAILLWTGSLPAEGTRMEWLRDFVPLPLVETSHFLGSLVGAALLLLARGLQRRVDAAWWGVVSLLTAGVVFSIGRGLDWEEALALSLALVLLLPFRRCFFRKASLLSQPARPEWLLSVGIVLIGAVWLGLLSFRHVAYENEAWWQFGWGGDAARFYRASAGAVALLVIIGLARLLRPAPATVSCASAAELAVVRNILASVPDTQGHLALMGDKSILLDDSGSSFLMFGVEGSTWVAMGDPVGGTREIRRDLVWRFREMAERAGGRGTLYEVAAEDLGLYVEAGFSLLKLGEEARVDLKGFTLEGARSRSLRSNVRHQDREGTVLEVIPAGESVVAIMDELKGVSDAWLSTKGVKEKRFSLGYFQPEYLAGEPVAVVRMQGRILAFANLWLGADGGELAVDLMRYHPEAPGGTMDYLFVKLMEWGESQGFHWFSLGMAPLAGLEERAMAAPWNRIASLVFRHGQHFYDFAGLRAYKEKFNPVWSPRFLAAPRGLSLPVVLMNIHTHISG